MARERREQTKIAYRRTTQECASTISMGVQDKSTRTSLSMATQIWLNLT